METIEICIPEDLQREIEQIKVQENIEMSDMELYQHLVRLGLAVVEKDSWKVGENEAIGDKVSIVQIEG